MHHMERFPCRLPPHQALGAARPASGGVALPGRPRCGPRPAVPAAAGRSSGTRYPQCRPGGRSPSAPAAAHPAPPASAAVRDRQGPAHPARPEGDRPARSRISSHGNPSKSGRADRNTNSRPSVPGPLISIPRRPGAEHRREDRSPHPASFACTAGPGPPTHRTVPAGNPPDTSADPPAHPHPAATPAAPATPSPAGRPPARTDRDQPVLAEIYQQPVSHPPHPLSRARQH